MIVIYTKPESKIQPIKPSKICVINPSDIPFDTIVFHSPCPDGFTAAWAYYYYLGAINSLKFVSQTIDADGEVEEFVVMQGSKKIRFLREVHDFATTKKLLQGTPKINVLFADICPPRDILIQAINYFDNTFVLDHHDTAEKECGDLPNTFFDQTRSGAGLVWDFFPYAKLGIARPLLVDVIEDRDLYKWVVPDSKALTLVIEMYQRTFENWDEIDRRFNEHHDDCVKEGNYYLRYHNRVIDALSSPKKIHKLVIGGYTVPAVNSNFFQSDIGNKLAKAAPKLFGAVYSYTGKNWSVSLRSLETGLHVGKIAKEYGGGGHVHASAFKVKDINDLRPSDFTDEELKQFNI